MHHAALGESVLMAERPGATATLRCVPGVSGVWLLRHGWSGTASVVCGASIQHIPLNSHLQDLKFVLPLNIPTDEPAELQITVNCAPGTPANLAQVWLLGLSFDKVPLPKPKVQTLSPTARLIDGEWGRFLVQADDADIPLGILNHGAWAPHDIEIFRKHVTDGDCVVDVGAHVGHHSIVFSKLVGDRGLVLSIEAQKSLFQFLNANCAINGAANVHAVHMAASDRSHELSLYPLSFARANLGSLGVNVDADAGRGLGGNRGEVVHAGCIDDLVERHLAGRRVGFIKIDVQSYEKYALRGLLRTITKDRPKVFVEIAPYWMRKAGYDYREIYEMLAALGYRFEHFMTLPLAADGVPQASVEERTEWDALALPL